MDKNKKFKILIVDEEKVNLDVLVHILRDSYTVYPAKSGEAALKKAAEIQPDLILLDIIMPDISGYEVLNRLKSDSSTAHIPVIFITALGSSEDEKRGLRLGAVDYIIKPFNSESVKMRIKTQLQLVQHLRTIEEIGMFDEATGMPNRKSFDNQLAIEWGRAVREKTPVSLIMIEARETAEETLFKVAGIIDERFKRITDFKARYDENMFAIILWNTDREGAMVVAEDISRSVRALEAQVTLNIGISTAQPAKDDPVSYFVLQADRNLFKAKTEGKEIVC
jgi:diguanylate cyclase (GGDEF)-like protein